MAKSQTRRVQIGMTKQQAIDGAKREAKKNGCDILVCESPLDVRSHNEFEEGAYGFCGEGAETYLFAYGVVVHRVNPNGDVHNFAPIIVDQKKFARSSETFESIAK